MKKDVRDARMVFAFISSAGSTSCLFLGILFLL